MKRFVILAGLAAALLLLLVCLPRGCSKGGTELAPKAVPQSSMVTNPPPNEPGIGKAQATEQTSADLEAAKAIKGSEQERIVQSFNDTANIPVAFYGQVVDQDTNPLESVQVDVVVSEEYMRPSLQPRSGPTIVVRRQTGPDGRFEMTGLKGHRVTITGLVKDGYEPEVGVSDMYGIYGAQSGSFSNPVVFRMWSTNIPHQHLVTGKESSAVVPDGRRYGIDLMSGVIAEGVEGDLVVSLERPASVGLGEKYGWSCELVAPGGMVEETRGEAMCVAPATGFSNLFAYGEGPGVAGWSGGLYGKRFYVRLRKGPVYGRVTLNLRASPSREGPAMISLQQTINPSGSRILR